MRVLQILLLVAFLAALVVFAWQNQGPITVQVFQSTIRTSVAVQAVAVYLLGMLTGGTVVSFLRRSMHQVRSAVEERRAR
jgi:uncharacterized integral membrane protein